MDSKTIVDLANILGPVLLALITLGGLVVNFMVSRDNNKKIVVMASDLKLTKEHINSRMTELLRVVSSEKLAVGEKIGMAKGIIQEYERSQAEAEARRQGQEEGADGLKPIVAGAGHAAMLKKATETAIEGDHNEAIKAAEIAAHDVGVIEGAAAVSTPTGGKTGAKI